MYFLLEFIRKYYYVLLFLLLEAVSFFMPVSYTHIRAHETGT